MDVFVVLVALIRTVFIDIHKAYDHVDHNLLVDKFIDRGVPHFMVKWFHSFLSHWRQQVKVNGDLFDAANSLLCAIVLLLSYFCFRAS